MDPVRLGRQVRALRRRRGWRQVDLALAAGTSRATISRVERGRLEELTVRSLRRIAQSLTARLDVTLNWNGEALDRLLDADHAVLVDRLAADLRGWGWDVRIEASFGIRGERGSIDVLAFDKRSRTVLVVEVKSVVPDLQATLHGLDRKARLGLEVARTQGWSGAATARLLVIGGTRTVRRRIAQHRATFDAVLPDRSTAVRQWLRAPVAGHPIAGLWVVTDARLTSARHRVPGGARPGHARAAAK